jgi:methyl-accepting chemotaxis protein
LPTETLFGTTNRNFYILISTVLFILSLSLIIVIIFSNKISNIFKITIHELNEESSKIKAVGNVLKSNAEILSSSVADQAASVHETSAAINEITSMINRTTENSKEATVIAKSSSQKSEEGKKIIHDLVLSMEAIQESNSQLQNISKIIGEIHTKTAVINDIVSKTELLSLNASIESARAGEIGKGFAVVAEEVGNLAKISGKSAQEIQDLIISSQEQVNKILDLTKDRVAGGKKITAEAEETFNSISDSIQSLAGVMNQIAEATREQEVGIRQISTAMSQIDTVTQKSQETSNSTTDASIQIALQSEKIDLTSKIIESLVNGK